MGIFSIVLCLAVCLIHATKCIAEEKQTEIEVLVVNPAPRDLEMRPIRIHFSYEGLDLTSDEQDMISEQVIHGAREWYDNVLNIKPLSSNLVLESTTCGDVTVRSKHRESGEAADVIVYVTVTDSYPEAYGFAVLCERDSDGYPLAGYMHLEASNLAQMSREVMLGVAIHEIAHVLAFNEELYSAFNNSTIAITEAVYDHKQFKQLESLQVTELAQKAFNCSDLTGVELDPSMNHWSKRAMYNDFMTPDFDKQDVVYSDISMAVFEDTGIYSVNYNYTTSIVWGKDRGCEFLETPCISSELASFEEFCINNQNTERCDFMHLHKGYCNLEHGIGDIPAEFQYFRDSEMGGIDGLIDYCPVVKQRAGGNCRNIDLVDSDLENELWVEEACEDCRCIEGTYVRSGIAVAPFQHAACHRILSCDHSLQVVSIEIDDQTINCPFDGGRVAIEGYDGFVDCPNSDILWATMPCMNNCNGVGVWVNGKCKCDPGYIRDDCSGSLDWATVLAFFALNSLI